MSSNDPVEDAEGRLEKLSRLQNVRLQSKGDMVLQESLNLTDFGDEEGLNVKITYT